MSNIKQFFRGGINKLTQVFVFLFLGYLIILSYVYFNQNNLLFYPDAIPEDSAHQCEAFHDFKRINLEGTVLFVREKSPTKAIVYYHGNAGNVCHRSRYIPLLTIDDYTLIFVEYESFLDPTVSPSLSHMVGDVTKTITWLDHNGYTDIVSVGRSLGTIFASTHAAMVQTRNPVSGVTLISPLSSVADVASSIYWYLPITTLLKEDKSNIAILETVQSPTLIIAGTADRTIPAHFSKKLHDSISGSQYVLIDGAKHSDVAFFPNVQQAIMTFIADL